MPSLTIAGVLLLFGSLAQAQSLTGQVVNDTGTPIANATIVFRDLGNQSVTIRNIRTDVDGRFSIAFNPGTRSSVLLTAWHADYSSATVSLPISAATAQITLGALTRISGTVTDKIGRPVRDARVLPVFSAWEYQVLATPFGGRPFTDANGGFVITGVPTGVEFILEATQQSDVIGRSSRIVIPESSRQVESISIVQRQKVSVVVTVSDHAGVPIPNAVVVVMATSFVDGSIAGPRRVTNKVTTDSKGLATLQITPGVDLRIRALSPGFSSSEAAIQIDHSQTAPIAVRLTLRRL